jgi:hypothetical protein
MFHCKIAVALSVTLTQHVLLFTFIKSNNIPFYERYGINIYNGEKFDKAVLCYNTDSGKIYFKLGNEVWSTNILCFTDELEM